MNESTVRHWIQRPQTKRKAGRPTHLSPAEELVLCAKIREASEVDSYSQSELCQLVNLDVIEPVRFVLTFTCNQAFKIFSSHPEWDGKEPPTSGWARGFLKRHPEVKFVKPARPLDVQRAQACTRPNIQAWMDGMNGHFEGIE